MNSTSTPGVSGPTGCGGATAGTPNWTAGWASLHPTERAGLIRQAASQFHAMCCAGQLPDQVTAAMLWPGGTSDVNTNGVSGEANWTELVRALRQLHAQASGVMTTHEQLRFLKQFARLHQIPAASLGHVLHHVQEAIVQAGAARARRIYRAALGDAYAKAGRGGVRGHWLPRPGIEPGALLDAVSEAEDAQSLIKRSSASTVSHAQLLGHEVVLKRFDHRSGPRGWRSRWRASRARRAFAAAEAMRAVGVGTPPALGYLELGTHDNTARSYYICEYVPGTCTMRNWIEQHHARLDASGREALGRLLADEVASLYRRGVYHADTKTLNMIVSSDATSVPSRLLWIDLEHVRPDGRPTRRQMLRNAVQLLGSLMPAVGEAERTACLQHLARRLPLLGTAPARIEIQWRTRWRLHKEARGWDGP